jgi:RimJ/RimL family protein N-acetyltransferase
VQLWYELDQDPEVMRYLNDGKPTPWEEMQQIFVPRVASFSIPEQGHGLWELRDKQTQEYLGWILARHYRSGQADVEIDNLELGWRLKRHCWGKGIATEGAQAVATALLDHNNIRVFSAIADPLNVASTTVMKKLGMRYIEMPAAQIVGTGLPG